MAAPAYATDLNDIFTDGGTWTVLSGRATDPDTDDFIQGTSCWSHDPFSSGIEGGVVNSAETVAADDAVFVWTKADISPALATHAAGGVQILIGASTTALDCFYVRGSDDLVYGGWQCIPVDPTFTPSTVIGGGGAGTSYFGVRWNIPGSGPSKGYPFKIDAIRHGRQLEITAGDSGTPATWDATAAYDAGNTRMWGLCQPTDTGAQVQGLIYWGTAAAPVYSRDSNRTIVLLDTEWTVTDFTQILFAHASNDVEWDNVGLIALGTNNRGIIDVTANGAVTWTNSVIQDIDTTTMLAGSTFDGCTWIGCNEVDSGGGSLLGASILSPTVAANSSALVWDVATDPDGLLDDMTFSKGTAAHHAIEFGTTIPDAASYTLRGCAFGTDFSATENGSTGDETFHFKDTTGTITLNLVGCTGNAGYRTEGVAVTIVTDPVTIALTVQTSASPPVAIGSARVFIETSDGTGPLPFEESVSIVQTSGTATVTHTAHGLVTGNYVVIRDATQNGYNKVAQITKTTDNAYTYAVDSGTVSPATGSPVASAVIISGLTNGSGVISDTRTYSSNQPFKGWARKSSGTPYYQNGPITGTISSTDGFTASIALLSDE